MKISVDIPDSELNEICRVTGESKKGPAIRKLVAEALRMKRRETCAEKFVSGEWGVELEDFEASDAADKQADNQGESAWRS